MGFRGGAVLVVRGGALVVTGHYLYGFQGQGCIGSQGGGGGALVVKGHYLYGFQRGQHW